MSEENPERPGFMPSSTNVHVATRDQQKPMVKLLGRMLKMKHPGKPTHRPSPKATGRKGLQSNQSVAIKHKQIFW